MEKLGRPADTTCPHPTTRPKADQKTTLKPPRRIEAKTDCQACPVRPECTSARRGNRMLTLYPEHLHTVLAAARAEQKTKTWKDKYALRAGVEGTINRATRGRTIRVNTPSGGSMLKV
ncbi:transposase [Streptomyces sp. NBC_01108]|uniref:transposase n=1 Tax=unclassified Streptomyces TaxID=2593676 RepID=UPI00352C4112|nr:transposase [Streptomyces sp. NBC_01241]WSU19747.1 transposase [Streptomyces sp. NBC_01108]